MGGKIDGINRRTFIQMAGATGLSAAVKPAFAQQGVIQPMGESGKNRMGVVVWIEDGESIDTKIRTVRELGFPVCQVGFETLTPGVTEPLRTALSKYGIMATALSEHGPGQRIFDFYQGPATIGIVPLSTRAARVRNLKMAADVAHKLGIPAIHTHIGFTPEDPNDPLYPQTVTALRDIAVHCKERGIIFLCEIGQETPVTLRRLIQDVGTGNVFVNLDFANLICYGKGNPVDAMDVIGELVRGTHAKDAVFPTGTWDLGKGVPFGKGKVDFPAVFAALRKVHYSGTILIEYEAGGKEANQAILRRKAYLEKLMGILSSDHEAS